MHWRLQNISHVTPFETSMCGVSARQCPLGLSGGGDFFRANSESPNPKCEPKVGRQLGAFSRSLEESSLGGDTRRAVGGHGVRLRAGAPAGAEAG